jgi:hypothetical protein
MPPATRLEAFPIESAHECLRCEVQVAVLLHVEVDELRHLRAICTGEAKMSRLAIESLQPVAKDSERVLPGERRDLRVDR